MKKITIREMLNEAVEILKSALSPTPNLDAEVLMANVLGVERFELFTSENRNKITQTQLKKFWRYISRRKKREPIAYITGYKEFWSLPIRVKKGVLIPRQETEILVEEVLKRIEDKNKKLDILEIGSGSGCIIAALSKELQNARFTLIEKSKSAIDISKLNLISAQKRVKILHRSIITPLQTGKKFDIIISNPPYLTEKEYRNSMPELRFEPKIALVAKANGMEIIDRIFEITPNLMKNGGYLALEIGENQLSKIKKLYEANKNWVSLEVSKAVENWTRSIILRWKN